MSEQGAKDEKSSLLEAYRKSGKMTTLTGIKPDEAVQKLIKEDPEKQKAFLDGAQEGQILKEQEDNNSQQKPSGKK
jgi:C-terminal processing protease CtpA/Prc